MISPISSSFSLLTSFVFSIPVIVLSLSFNLFMADYLIMHATDLFNHVHINMFPKYVSS